MSCSGCNKQKKQYLQYDVDNITDEEMDEFIHRPHIQEIIEFLVSHDHYSSYVIKKYGDAVRCNVVDF